MLYRCATIFIYANGIIILCPTRSSTEQVLKICADYCNNIGLLFNYSKCKVILFSENSSAAILPIRLNEIPLDYVSNEKHLGHRIQNTQDFVNFDNIVFDLRAKCNSIKRNFSHLNTESKIKLFNTHCNTFYGCELCDIMSNQFNHIFVNWRKSIRYLLDLPYRTHCCLLPHIVDVPNASTQIFQRIICFFKKGLHHGSTYVQAFYRHCLMNNNSFMTRNVNIICRKIDISPHDLVNKTLNQLKTKLRATDPPWDWRSNIIKELLAIRDGTFDCILDVHEIDNVLNFLCEE